LDQGIPARFALRTPEGTREFARILASTPGRGPSGADTLDTVHVGDVGAGTDWSAAVQGIEAVVHLAARSHVLKERSGDPLAAYRAVNVEGTRRLAEQAAAAGVRRLIYLSSIKVNGEQTRDRAFSEQDLPRPEDAYGVSKWEAEQALWDIAARSRLEVVVLRPPLLYGGRVKGNFLSLMHAVARGMPLPIAAVNNRRSLLYVGSLSGAILQCIGHPVAAGKTYLVADGMDVSSPDLARLVGNALGRRARLVPVPAALLRLAGALAGRSATISRLLGSLQVDASKIRADLGWTGETDMSRGLAEAAAWYRQAHGSTPSA
jgi:nucleoside-diphosphate-sugar epimerase